MPMAAFDRVKEAFLTHASRIVASPVLENIVAQRYGRDEIAAVGCLGLFLVFLRCSIGGRRLSVGSLLWYYWFTVVGVFGAVFESYYVLFTQNIVAGRPRNFLDAFWSQYAAVDSRSGQVDEYFYMIKTISCIFSVPLAFLIAHSIKNKSFFQFPAQLVASTVLFVCHWILVLSNLNAKFVFTDVASNPANLTLFLAHHGLFIGVSFASIVRALYYCDRCVAPTKSSPENGKE